MTNAEAGRTATDRVAWRVWSRALVHLSLLLTAAGALATLTILYIRNAIHADIGLVFVGLVVVHLAQRRRTVARMMSQLAHARPFAERRIRIAGSGPVALVHHAQRLGIRTLGLESR